MKNLLLALLVTVSVPVAAHDIDYGNIMLRHWQLTDHLTIEGSLLMYKNDTVYIQDAGNNVRRFPLKQFSEKDRQYVTRRYAAIEKQLLEQPENLFAPEKAARMPGWGTMLLLLLVSAAGVYVFRTTPKGSRPYLRPAFYGSLLLIIYSFTDKDIRNRLLTTTDPYMVEAAFTPFRPAVHTHWDNQYFYVESKGIPAHPMMAGITAWQQQVPIPQCYTTANNNNAWSIPLNPVMADIPVPVNQQHFLRGAIAIAVNGVAIFNPYTNTGVDAYLDGQLDNWGGHCGRADDYHYHIAPLHLYSQTQATLPIAFALDGYAVYGSKEPDGTDMTPLDANHGHFGVEGRYHYHGTASAPYMIGRMAGKVTEDNTLQIIPQATARPVRPSLTPLTGAVITNCQPNAGNNGYSLSYTRSGQNYQVNYDWVDFNSNSSKYNFHFVNPGSTTDTFYIGFSQSQCVIPTVPFQPGIRKTMLRLPDTGEESGFTGTFGEDADFQMNTPFFTGNGNGTVTDTITGLMWQMKDGGEMTIEQAALYCDTLTLGGYSNWRLPTAAESFSILNLQFANPAIDTGIFTRTTADYWWTATRQQNDTNKVWTTNAGGGIGNKPRNETISAGGSFRYHTRAVREINAPQLLAARFADNGNGTITDLMTNLTWQQQPRKDSLNWEESLQYADTLTLGNITEWRLPNIRELRSICDESFVNPGVDTGYIKVINNKKYWSSTTLSNHSNEAWVMQTRYGITTYDLKTAANQLICVSNASQYEFNGNGNWTDAANWVNRNIPPAVLPAGYSIIINPVSGGLCLLNTLQHIAKGAGIRINAGKNLVISGSLNIQE